MHASPHDAAAPQTLNEHRGHVELPLHTPSPMHAVPQPPLHLPLTHIVQYGNAYVPHSASAAQVSPQNLPSEHTPFTQLPHPPLPAPLQSEEAEQAWPQASWHVSWETPGRGAHTGHDELQSVVTPHVVPHFPPSTQTVRAGSVAGLGRCDGYEGGNAENELHHHDFSFAESSSKEIFIVFI